MNKQSRTNGIFLALGEILVGILLLVNPVGFTSGIIMAGGIILAAIGLYNIVLYFKTEPDEAAEGRRMALGLISLAAGLFCALRSQWFTTTFSLLTIIYGAAVIAVGLSKVQTTVDLIRCKKPRWYFSAIGAAATLVCGTVVLLNPFAATKVLWQFTAISLLAEAVLDLVAIIASGSLRKETSAE